MDINHKITLTDAFVYLKDGMALALSRDCRMYILIPVLVNMLLLSLCGYLIYSYLKELIFNIVGMWPAFLLFLAYIITILLGGLLIFLSCYFFSFFATILASPFYGLLAEKVECKLRGTTPPNTTVTDLMKDIPRIILRELRKQWFFLPKALLCLIITIIPVVNVLSPIPWFLLTAWMGCLQYVDYAFDNHKIPFPEMNGELTKHALPSFAFGAVIAVSLSIPILNMLVPPAAVCAGTKYYLEMRKFRPHFGPQNEDAAGRKTGAGTGFGTGAEQGSSRAAGTSLITPETAPHSTADSHTSTSLTPAGRNLPDRPDRSENQDPPELPRLP